VAGEIAVQAQPYANYFQTHAYKAFPPHIRAEKANWANGLTLATLPANAVIARPREGEKLKAGRVLTQGYAIAGGDPSNGWNISDEGKTWVAAELPEAPGPWGWRFWETEMVPDPGVALLSVRAWDSAAQTQPEDLRKIWNFKGYGNNAWHRVRVTIGFRN
jgi:sulfite oxidase